MATARDPPPPEPTVRPAVNPVANPITLPQLIQRVEAFGARAPDDGKEIETTTYWYTEYLASDLVFTWRTRLNSPKYTHCEIVWEIDPNLPLGGVDDVCVVLFDRAANPIEQRFDNWNKATDYLRAL